MKNTHGQGIVCRKQNWKFLETSVDIDHAGDGGRRLGDLPQDLLLGQYIRKCSFENICETKFVALGGVAAQNILFIDYI